MNDNRREKLKRLIVRAVCVCGGIGILAAAYIFSVSAHVISAAEDYIIDASAITGGTYTPSADCILVLGCGVDDDGYPRMMLRDRLNCAIDLYDAKAAPKLLMSGDHGRKTYDEVNAMKKYAMDTGISSSDIFMDHAGFSTYESMYRARDVFDVDSVIIVTQKYHLYRAVYIARSLGLEAYGVACDPGEYHGQIWLDSREVLARGKDFVYTIIKPKPTYLGDVIPISGDGDLTADGC